MLFAVAVMYRIRHEVWYVVDVVVVAFMAMSVVFAFFVNRDVRNVPLVTSVVAVIATVDYVASVVAGGTVMVAVAPVRGYTTAIGEASIMRLSSSNCLTCTCRSRDCARRSRR